jgi:hypothetical protein
MAYLILKNTLGKNTLLAIQMSDFKCGPLFMKLFDPYKTACIAPSTRDVSMSSTTMHNKLLELLDEIELHLSRVIKHIPYTKNCMIPKANEFEILSVDDMKSLIALNLKVFKFMEIYAFHNSDFNTRMHMNELYASCINYTIVMGHNPSLTVLSSFCNIYNLLLYMKSYFDM